MPDTHLPAAEYSVLFVQEAHETPAAEASWRLVWENRIYFSYFRVMM